MVVLRSRRRVCGNCAKAGALVAEAFANSGGNDSEEVGRRPSIFISTAVAVSTGHLLREHPAARSGCVRAGSCNYFARGRPRSDDSVPVRAGVAPEPGCRDSHRDTFDFFGADLVCRIDAPFSSIRCALCKRRSQMASAWFGSPMTPCQSETGSWLAIRVEERSLRSSMTSIRSRRSLSRRGARSQSSIASRSSLPKRVSSRV